jgi:hypothetical protein
MILLFELAILIDELVDFLKDIRWTRNASSSGINFSRHALADGSVGAMGYQQAYEKAL